MVTYPFFDEAFDEDFKGVNEWKNEFSQMTHQEFDNFFEYVFIKRLGKIITDTPEKAGSIYMLMRLPMMVALCSKQLEAAHFCGGVSQDWRELTDRVAQNWFSVLMSILGHTKQGLIAKSAWDADCTYVARFGYKSGSVFEMLAPHSVFSDM